MYWCESWTIKKAECWRIDAFELWYWRRLLRVPWTARRSNQSILGEISPEYSLKDWGWSWNSNTLATSWDNWFIGKDPDAGKGWRQEKKGTTEDEMVGWHHRLNGHEFEQALKVGNGQGSLVCCSSWVSKESDVTERLNWTKGLTWAGGVPLTWLLAGLSFLLIIIRCLIFLPHLVLHRAGHNVVVGLFQSACQREREGNQVVNGSAVYSQCWKLHP